MMRRRPGQPLSAMAMRWPACAGGADFPGNDGWREVDSTRKAARAVEVWHLLALCLANKAN